MCGTTTTSDHIEALSFVRQAVSAADPRRHLLLRSPPAFGVGIVSVAAFTSTTRPRHDAQVSEPYGPLQHSRVLQVLHNPRYAGAFFYGRHTHRIGPGGKPTIHLLPREQWTVLITDAHPGYLSFAEFEANQARLAELAAARGTDRRASPPREGPALLQGLIVCGRCGTRMTVRYHTRADGQVPEYVCQAEGIRHGTPICQRIPGVTVDAAVARLLVDTLTPLAIQAALTVAEELVDRADQADRIRAAAVERARYQADLARRRYLAVDPQNRLVADSLEADWNTALRELADATDAYQHATQAGTGQLSATQRQRITQLATDFPALWNDPATPQRERKRLIRLLISDVTLTRTDQITAHVRLRGGQDHSLHLPIPLAAWQLRQTPPEVVSAIDQLLDDHTDAQIATILSSRGLVSGTGQPLHARLIGQIRTHYQLPSHPQRLRDAGLLSLAEIARRLAIHPNTVKKWRNDGLLTGRLANDKGEYLYQLPGPDLVRPRTGRPPRRPSPTTTTKTTAASTTGGAV